MVRNEAKSYCFYSLDYFHTLFAKLGERAVLAEARLQERIASSAIFLLGEQHAWYYFAGTVPEMRSTCANNRLVDQMILWSALRGFDYLILGGGLKPGDGMFMNKRGYSHLSAPQYHFRKVHNPQMLERLQRAKADYDRSRGKITRTDYFPCYWLD